MTAGTPGVTAGSQGMIPRGSRDDRWRSSNDRWKPSGGCWKEGRAFGPVSQEAGKMPADPGKTPLTAPEKSRILRGSRSALRKPLSERKVPLSTADLLSTATTASLRPGEVEIAPERRSCTVSEDPGGFKRINADLGVILAISGCSPGFRRDSGRYRGFSRVTGNSAHR